MTLRPRHPAARLPWASRTFLRLWTRQHDAPANGCAQPCESEDLAASPAHVQRLGITDPSTVMFGETVVDAAPPVAVPSRPTDAFPPQAARNAVTRTTTTLRATVMNRLLANERHRVLIQRDQHRNSRPQRELHWTSGTARFASRRPWQLASSCGRSQKTRH